MLALRIKNQTLGLEQIPRPVKPDEAVVRVTLSGICNTDLELVRGYAGFSGTPGHEFVGVVESSPLPGLAGQRVVGEINAGCRTCELCRGGDSRHCGKRTVLGIVGRDGAHAEYLQLPVSNLLVVPAGISDEQAVFVEPLAAALGITERVVISKGQRVAVIGDGKLGLLCAQALSVSNADVTLIGKHLNKLQIAARRGIPVLTLEEVVLLKREFDVVVEASGNDSGFDLAIQLLKPRGVLVLKSTFHATTAIDASRLVVDEITIVGSRCGRFAPALELLRNEMVDVKSLISEEFPLGSGVDAFKRASDKGVIKVLLRP